MKSKDDNTSVRCNVTGKFRRLFMSKRIFAIMILATLMLGGACGIAFSASVPTQLTIQGVLLTSDGNPPAAGNKTFTFRIFDMWSGGTQVWPTPAPMGEEQIISTNQSGLWTAQVGAVVPLSASIFDGAERWLDITVNDGINPPETLTRIPIKASPYAYRVATLEGADGGTSNDTMGVRDPGGNVSVLGAGGLKFEAGGGPVSGPQGITFLIDGITRSGQDADSIWVDSGDADRVKIGADGLVFTGSTDTGFVAWIAGPGLGAEVGINTGHPIEALTVVGAVRAMDDSDADLDPWIGARKSLVIAKEGADEWGRSVDGDSAGVYFPADDDDFAIMSSKALVDKTEMRISVGDNPDDHILLMPSGNVGINTTAPIAKLHVAGSSRVEGPLTLGTPEQGGALNIYDAHGNATFQASGVIHQLVVTNSAGIGTVVLGGNQSGDALTQKSPNVPGTGVVGVYDALGGMAGFLSETGIDLYATNSNRTFYVNRFTGNACADGTITQNGGCDVAENMTVVGPVTDYEPGDVLILSATEVGRLELSSQQYSKRVAGIHSTQPGFHLGSNAFGHTDNQVPLALNGVVPCKVTTENGSIEVGDLLVSSSIPGHAMKATDPTAAFGAVIGKAMEPLISGHGVIKVLVVLQ